MIPQVERTSWKTRVASCALFAVILLGVAAVVLGFRARQEFTRGMENMRQGEVDKALSFFERSIGAAVPLDPVQVKAAKEMMEVARTREKEGDLQGSVRAYDRLRAALEETRPLFGFRRKAFEKAERRSEIVGEKIRGETGSPDRGDVAVTTRPFFTAMALFSFFLWVYGASMLSFKVPTKHGKWRPWALITLVSLVCWITFLGLS